MAPPDHLWLDARLAWPADAKRLSMKLQAKWIPGAKREDAAGAFESFDTAGYAERHDELQLYGKQLDAATRAKIKRGWELKKKSCNGLAEVRIPIP
jgi:hypothetical protein